MKYFYMRYHWRKDKNKEVYNEIVDTYNLYIAEEFLRMLINHYGTQTNEATNKSISVFASKGKTFSLTESLETRVGIAAGIAIVGYKNFWREVFDKFSLEFDCNLE